MPVYAFHVPATVIVSVCAETEADARTLLRYEAEEMTTGLMLPDLSPRLRTACLLVTDEELREAELAQVIS